MVVVKRRRALDGCVRISVSLPADLVVRAKQALGQLTMSAFVSEALEAKLSTKKKGA